MLQHTREAVTFAVAHGLAVMYVTEDTVRAHPATLRRLFLTAIECGAKRLCLCDTVGHATPSGVRNLLGFTHEVVQESGARVGIDWHGHSDRGFAVINTIAAIRAGATPRARLRDRHRRARGQHAHGPAAGEPAAARLDRQRPHRAAPSTARRPRAYTGVPIPVNYPMVGSDAFRTGTGVHAAAVIKAFRKGEDWLADRVYSGVPASLIGRRQEIEVGPMSGESNVVYWLEIAQDRADARARAGGVPARQERGPRADRRGDPRRARRARRDPGARDARSARDASASPARCLRARRGGARAWSWPPPRARAAPATAPARRARAPLDGRDPADRRYARARRPTRRARHRSPRRRARSRTRAPTPRAAGAAARAARRARRPTPTSSSRIALDEARTG